MIYNKNISLGISLNLSFEDYKEIFKKYHMYIKEIYSSTTLNIDKLHSRKNIVNEVKDKNNETKLIRIIKLAKEYDINFELAINSRFDLDEWIIKEVYEWCNNNNIVVDKIVTLNNLVETCYKYFGNIDYCYSYNNNITSENSIEQINKLFSEVVIGNRCLRNINIMKLIKNKNMKIKLLLDNGCSHNCFWCSTLNASSCYYVFDENIKKYNKEFLIAIQTVFPYEVKEYYSKLCLIDSYKISTRSTDKFYLIGTLEHYVNNTEIKNKSQIPFTGKLRALNNFVDKNEIDLYKIHKIKDKIWSDVLNGR